MKNILTNKELIEPFICTIGGKCGSGKTSIQIMMLDVAIREGKSVLFLNSETPRKIIIEKLQILNPFIFSNILQIVDIKYGEDLCIKLESILEDKSFDLIIMDDSFIIEKENLEKALKFLKNKKISVILSAQLKQIPTNNGYNKDPIPYIPMIMSNYVYSIEKKNEFIKKEKIKNILMFWKPKPNMCIRLLKDRDGDTSVTNVNINFKKLTIKK